MTTLAKWNEPKQFRMGFVGADRTPIYASCADCLEKDAVIAGDMRNAETNEIGVIKRTGEYGLPEYHMALFCSPCFTVRWDALLPALIPRATYAEVAASGWFENPD